MKPFSRKVFMHETTDRDGDVLRVYNTVEGGLTFVSDGTNSKAKRPEGTNSSGMCELRPDSARRAVAAMMDLRENVEPPPDPWSPGLAAPRYQAQKWMTWGVDGPVNMRGQLLMILRPPREAELVFAVGANADTAGAVLADRQVDVLIRACLELLNGNDPAAAQTRRPLI